MLHLCGIYIFFKKNKRTTFGVRKCWLQTVATRTWIPILIWPLVSSVTFSKLLHLSTPCFLSGRVIVPVINSRPCGGNLIRMQRIFRLHV